MTPALAASPIAAHPPPPPAPARGPPLKMATKLSTGGGTPRKQLASKAARRSGVLADEETPVVEDNTNPVQIMHKLINLQTFSGAWAWNGELFAVLGMNEMAVNKRDIGSSPETCATALVIAYLETKAATKRDVWEMVVSKARAWLGKQVGDGNGVDDVVRKAAGYF